MKEKPTRNFLIRAIAALLVSVPAIVAAEAVEMSIDKTLKLESVAVDMVPSADGSLIFVLTDQGEILVYSKNGDVQGRIDVGKDVDQIRLAPKGDGLFLNSRKSKTLKVASLDFVVDIDVAGSPFKGRENAPVTVAVFSDFQ